MADADEDDPGWWERVIATAEAEQAKKDAESNKEKEN